MSVQREMTLEEWVAKLPTIHLAHKEFDALNATITEQAAQIKALEKDAARYKWLKENKAHNNTHCWHFQHGPIIPGLLTLDAAIDAAMLGDSHGN